MDAMHYFLHRDDDRMTAANDADDGASRGTRRTRIGALIGVVIALAVAAVVLPPLAQSASYHAFADARTILGVPNFWNVGTNLAILAAGVAGFGRTLREPAHAAGRMCRLWLFGGFMLTAFGSTWYHLAPDSDRLVWDRLPMTIAFMSLVAALIAQRIDARAGRLLLVPLVTVGLASVLWWQWTSARGAENVVPYALVQLGSIALVLLIAGLFPLRAEDAETSTTADARKATYGTIAIVVAGVLYALAKGVELLDERIYLAGGLLSGHSIKHLLVAAVGFQLIRAFASPQSRVGGQEA